jgi:hypothetical protein
MNNNPSESHEIFDQDTFTPAFIADLNQAKGLVLLQSPFMTVRRIDELKGAFKNCARRGVRVCVFAQEPSAWHSDAENRAQLEEAKQSLLSLGMHVTLRQNIHEKPSVSLLFKSA